MDDLGATEPHSMLEHIDFERLESWMDREGLESGQIQEPVLLGGGTQNVIIRFRRGRHHFVLRRPPLHPRENSNTAIVREITILAALRDTEVPHSKLIAGCSDPTLLGTAFYLMEAVDGFTATMGLPRLHAENSDVRQAMGMELAQSAAALGELDFEKLNLAEFGKREGFLQRQVSRWRHQLEGYGQFAKWPGLREIPNVDRIGRWLEDNLPAISRTGIIHGDYHIANVMFRYDGPELAAIIDWELATIGDPLIDLGWLIATWPDETGDLPIEHLRVTPWEGFPTQAELVERYRLFSTRDLKGVAWYVVLACYKLGIILEGTYARACGGKAPLLTGERLHAATLKLFERALRWM